MQRMFPWLLILAIIIGSGVYLLFFQRGGQSQRDLRVIEWQRNPQAHSDWALKAQSHCASAPFLIPTSGFIGYLWGDTFQPGHPHQGIDIFGGADPGKVAIYSVYNGFLTRLVDWKSTVIIRIPSDPLQPDRQIWTYYTHMADAVGNPLIDARFSPGTSELFIPAGTLLGWQGNYSGTAGNPVGVHLHFSIIQDENGKFKNELDIGNTLDPSPYFGIDLNVNTNQGEIPSCHPRETTP